MIDFLIGADGGGSGTRVLLAKRDGRVIGAGRAGPSALSRGIEPAWAQIVDAITQAFAAADLPLSPWRECALGAGLSGAIHPPWHAAFRAADPGFAHLVLDSDSYTMLLGAHGGEPGAVVAAGTGSIGEVLHADGSRASVGGWGFPIGDEGSGAWLGWQAVRYAHAAIDGRVAAGRLAASIQAECGADRDHLLGWARAAGAFEFASLAPIVFDCEAADVAAAGLLAAAVGELESLARTLDPAATSRFAITGSVGRRLAPRLSSTLRSRCVEPAEGSDGGALILVRQSLQGAS